MVLISYGFAETFDDAVSNVSCSQYYRYQPAKKVMFLGFLRICSDVR